MPASLQQRLLEASWDKVTAAVTAGLAGSGKESMLADVVPLSARPYGPPQTRFEPWESEESPRHRIVAGATGEFVEVRFDRRFALDVDDLLDFTADDAVKDWAAEARRRELTAVLELLLAAGRHAPLNIDSVRGALPDGHGSPEFVVWEPLPAGMDVLTKTFGQAPKTVERPHVQKWMRGLILRLAGGPSVRRGQDFTLDWQPAGEGVELVLMAHLRLYNVRANTVTTLVDPVDLMAPATE